MVGILLYLILFTVMIVMATGPGRQRRRAERVAYVPPPVTHAPPRRDDPPAILRRWNAARRASELADKSRWVEDFQRAEAVAK